MIIWIKKEKVILFIDEIHRLNRQVEEVLYPAMEDYAIDVMIGKGESARSIRLNLPKFTLVGATTRAGMLSAPLRDRFGVVNHMEFYTHEELKTIIINSAKVLGVKIDEKGAFDLDRWNAAGRPEGLRQSLSGSDGKRMCIYVQCTIHDPFGDISVSFFHDAFGHTAAARHPAGP